jgi:tetraacyldisaccharide 4'-kinase
MSAQSWLKRIWYARDAPPRWLLPFGFLFGAGTGLRRWLYRKQLRGTVRLSRPVVVVGNLSVGGTGKTPLVCWLVERLQELGFRPGVVTRGYGGSNRAPRLLRESDTAALVGDEPLLLARRTRVPVAVGRKRAAAARMLADAGCDVIVSDDGLQHYALSRDCEIAVIDAERGFGNGHLLPAGPLREGKSRLATVDAIVVNGASVGAGAGQPAGGRPAGGEPRGVWPAGAENWGGAPGRVFGMHLEAVRAVSLLDSSSRDLHDFAGQRVHAVAGIGNPQRFFAMLRAFGMQVSPRELPDHAALKRADIEFGDDLPVLMTEKDAVKCAGWAREVHWYVPVSVSFDIGGGAQFLEAVTRSIATRSGATR